MKALTHTEIQEGAVRALKLAMKKGVAHETRQVGDDIQITTVMEQDVEGKVLAVSYPDGGIDYYPTENLVTKDILNSLDDHALNMLQNEGIYDDIVALQTRIGELQAVLVLAEALIDGPVSDRLTGDVMNDIGAYDTLTVIREAIRG